MAPYHPEVIRQGWDPEKVDIGLKAELDERIFQRFFDTYIVPGEEDTMDVEE